jgi:ABC-2 type transport system permease protein
VLTALLVLAFDVPLPTDWAAFVALLALTLLASLGIGYLIAACPRPTARRCSCRCCCC